jgi:two-component system OmpR family sensor kinase
MMVRRARVRLTGVFIAVFAVVLVTFSIVFYVAFAIVLQPDFDVDPELTNQQAAEAAYNTAIDRIGFSLLTADVVAIVLVGAVAWLLARRTLEPIRDAHVRQQRFVADASHETRNPLAAIKATTGAALSGDRTPEQLRAALESVDGSVDRLIHLTGDLLTLARTNDPLAPSERIPSDLSVIVTEALADGHVAGDGSVLIERELEPDLPVAVDPSEIDRIVRNLVDNAIRYGGGPIAVRTARADGEAMLEVRDHGPGIAADDLERVFDPFYRAAGQARDRDGSGLGLSIARDLAHRNGGRLTVTSSPGKGATFRLSLPRRG